jgi:glycosyltransferase involved in cell wall biosynthesis
MDPAGPAILVVSPGPPFDPLTWSGTSHHLLAALRRRGNLIGAVDGWTRPLNTLEKAASIGPDMALWRQRYLANSSPLSRPIRAGMTEVARARAKKISAQPDVVLQFGGWYDLGAARGFKPKLHTFYADGTLALSLARNDNLLDGDSRWVRQALAYEKRLYDRLDVVMTMSDWLGRSFVEHFDQDPAKIVTVGAGANMDGSVEPPERDFSKPRILFVGKEFDRKGGPQLLAAFAALRQERPDAELWIVSEYQPSDPPEGVTFFGRILRDTPEGDAQIQRLYREATAFALPSVYEPFGIAVLESMAWHLPGLGADRCAIPEMIVDGVSGVLVDPEDPDSLLSGLRRLIADPAQMRTMGEAARKRFEERFTWDSVADRMIATMKARLGQ